MALPNTDKLTSQLAMMPDPALKRMAMMHKQDPYVLPLIIAEDSRRKQMRAAGQAAQYAPQPKVVDQEVAQLGVLPEQQGIGMLPAQNIAQMADGGIAGYADGGDFAQRSEPVLRMADGGIVALAGGGTGTYSYRPYESEKLLPETTGYENMSFGDMVSDIGSKISGFFGSEEENLAKRRREEIARENARREAENAAMKKLYGSTSRAPYGGREPPPPMPGDAAPTADTGSRVPAPGAVRQGLGALATGAAPAVAGGARPGAAPLSVDDTAAQLELQTMKDERQREGERAMSEFENMMQMRRDNPAFAKLEAALDKEEAASAGEKDKAAGLALLMAGLGIAGGSSQYGIQNLKEALPAVKEYQSAMNDLKKLERERMKMRGDIEQFRRAEERDDEKTMMALRNRMEDRKDKIDEKGTELTSKVLGLKTQQATEVWKTLTEQQGALQRTQITANALPAELRAASILGTGNTQQEVLESGLRKLETLKGEKPELAFAKLYADHVANSQRTMTEPMSPTEFARTIRSATTAFRPRVVETDKPGGSARVYER